MKYTIEEIQQMPEGQTFNCKSSHIEPKAIANTNTIVAMANADGDMITIGISDKARRRVCIRFGVKRCGLGNKRRVNP